MKNPNHDEPNFRAAVKRDLDQSVEELTPDITTRLRTARRVALHQQPKGLPWLRPAWGVATACAVGLALMVFWSGQPGKSPNPVLEDVDLLASSDSLDLYEDLDFYYWLTEHDQTS